MSGPSTHHRGTPIPAPGRPPAPISLRELRDVDPYPAYERIRDAGPVTWDEGMRAWLVVGHDDCTFVMRREDLFAEPTGSLPDAHRIVGRRDIRSLVGGEHEQLHRAVSHAWRPAPIAHLALEAVQPLVADRVAQLADTPRFELYEHFARLLPIAVISRVLGLPDADAATLHQARSWMEAVLAWRHSYGEDPVVRAAAIEATRRLEPLLEETVRDRRDHPRDDAISLIWAVGRAIFPDWSERDVIDNAKFMYEGGSETTAFLICTAIHHLLRMAPARRTATLADRVTFAAFQEEVLRHSTVVHLRARTATQDVVISGIGIRAGERVIAITAAANRDPGRWERPSELDPQRPRLYGHLAFSVGPRHCAGSHLARLEASEAIRGLFRAFPDLDRAPDQPETRPLGFVSRAWRPIVLEHRPLERVTATARVMEAGTDPAATTPGHGDAAPYGGS